MLLKFLSDFVHTTTGVGFIAGLLFLLCALGMEILECHQQKSMGYDKSPWPRAVAIGGLVFILLSILSLWVPFLRVPMRM